MNTNIGKWIRNFKQNRSPSAAADLSEQLQEQYARILTSQAPADNRHLQAQWENLIAPGLALYRTLLAADTRGRDLVLEEVEAMFKTSFFVAERRFVTFLNLLPDPFPLVRIALKKMTKNQYVPGASAVIEDSKTCFAANTYRCFILDTLTMQGAPELASIYCKTDDWLAAALPKVRWLRTKTLANGAELCDFRWCSLENSGPNR